MPTALLLLGLLMGVIIGGGIGHAHESSPASPSADADRARDAGAMIDTLTAQVLDQRLDMAERQRLAQARRERLAELLDVDPAEVLKRALPAAARARLAPALQALVEEEDDHEGVLQVLHVDGGPGGDTYLYDLKKPSGERIALRFADGAPALASGARIHVHGVRVDQVLALGSSGVTLLGAPVTSNTFGNRKALIVIVKFQDAPTASYASATDVGNLVFGTGNSVTNFYREASYQQTWFTGDVIGPFVIPISRAGCNYDQIANLSQAAARTAGAILGAYSHLVYAFPGNGCGWRGLGSVGGSPSEAWINGSVDAGVLSHELGHNLGLFHSHSLECGSASLATSGCSSIDYGDYFDTMGLVGSMPYHFNAVQKELLGWLGYGVSPPLYQVQSSGTYTIEPLETAGTQPRALKVQTLLGDWIYVEYRRPTGFDASMSSYPGVMNGVLVHYWTGDRDGVYLLDMTPATASWYDPALAVGATFTDVNGGVSISPAFANGATAGVTVTVGGGCARKNAAVSVSPVQQAGNPGTPLSYAISVLNNDTGCGTSAFTISVTPPSGWAASLGTTVATIAPGATWTGTLQLTSPSGATAGAYTAAIAAAHSGYSSSATAGYVVNEVSVGGGTTDPGPGGGTTGGAGSFSDDFTRPDSATPGNGWTAVSGSFKIVANELRNDAVRATHVIVQPGLAGATQSVTATFASTNNNTAPQLGVVLRYQGPGSYYRCYRTIGGTSVLRISRVVNGVETVLKAVSLPNAGANVLFTLGCQMSGNTLTMKLNGATWATATDATYATGSVGAIVILPLSGVASHRIDNFTATVN